MKRIIDINEAEYKFIKDLQFYSLGRRNGKIIEKHVINAIKNSTPYNPSGDYSQGWHDAITKALNEAYTITTEGGSFKVVQTETLEGLGMSMPMPEKPQGEWKPNCGVQKVYKGRKFNPFDHRGITEI